MVFVGRLAKEEELSLTLIDRAITFSTTSNKITFYIKCLSEVPESIEDHFEYKNKIFTATTNSYQNRALMSREGVDFEDRKSTRLNSSHVSISYAVFCLKKKI